MLQPRSGPVTSITPLIDLCYFRHDTTFPVDVKSMLQTSRFSLAAENGRVRCDERKIGGPKPRIPRTVLSLSHCSPTVCMVHHLQVERPLFDNFQPTYRTQTDTSPASSCQPTTGSSTLHPQNTSNALSLRNASG